MGDFYYCAGEGDRRRWNDMRRHGFISAGGGRWYSRTLRALEPGHRVWAHIPRIGYVGVGEVLAPGVPVCETGLLDKELEAPSMDRGLDDPDRCEYVVRVRWLVALAREDAFWIPGLYANENSVTKLRDSWTLQRLSEAFGVGWGGEGVRRCGYQCRPSCPRPHSRSHRSTRPSCAT